jgi:DNA (cytosine-5)-methyltransferase 1
MGRKKPRAIDLFCGCGGLTLGLRQAGFRVLGAVDNDPIATATYKRNHSRVHVWKSDIAGLSVAEVRRRLGLRKGDVELLAGCPPCQGFSRMRTLNGLKRMRDDRNWLIDEFLRFVRGLLPRALMMENVPKLKDYHRFSAFRRELRRLGYHVSFEVRDAADFGVPQRRRRLILLAGRKHEIQFPKALQTRNTVFTAIGKLPPAGSSGDKLHDFPEDRSEKVRDLIRRIPKNGGSRRDLPSGDQLECHKKCDGFKDVYGRMAWNDVAPTITTGCFNPSKGRFLHPDEDRAITMREAALLQGFPCEYEFPAARSKSGVALMIGNALPPPFIREHARAIKDWLEKDA